MGRATVDVALIEAAREIATYRSDWGTSRLGEETRSVARAKEFSNTDIARELVNLTHYSTMFRANLRVLETSNELLDDLFRLQRR